MTALTWVGIGACCVCCGFLMASAPDAFKREWRSSRPWYDRATSAVAQVLIRAACYGAFLACAIWLVTTL